MTEPMCCNQALECRDNGTIFYKDLWRCRKCDKVYQSCFKCQQNCEWNLECFAVGFTFQPCSYCSRVFCPQHYGVANDDRACPECKTFLVNNKT